MWNLSDQFRSSNRRNEMEGEKWSYRVKLGPLVVELLLPGLDNGSLSEGGVVWTSLGPLSRWVPGPTTRWAPGTTWLALHGI
jgi:hypothetical protein